jgi:hypothetical protein
MLSGYLLTIPVFDQYWYRDAHINEVFDATHHTREVNVRSSEYLNGTSIAHDGRDTVISARTTRIELPPGGGFDTTWFRVERKEEQHEAGDATIYEVRLRFTAKTRPLSVTLSYSSGGEALRAFDTPCQFRSDGGTTRIEWYSFPDSEMSIPVSFASAGRRSVTETVEARFAGLADPVRITGEMTYVIPRTTVVSSFVYQR